MAGYVIIYGLKIFVLFMYIAPICEIKQVQKYTATENSTEQRINVWEKLDTCQKDCIDLLNLLNEKVMFLP